MIGYIIEQLTNKSYSEAVNDTVIKPLKLKDTSSDFFEVACKSFSTGHYYNRRNDIVIPAMSYYHVPLTQAAGGIFSNLKDLERLTLCLMQKGELEGEQVFESKIIEDICFPHSKNFTASAPYYGFMNLPNNAYGYGLFMFDYSNLKFIALGGSGTQMTFMAYEPEAKFAIIVLSNISGEWFIHSFKKIYEVVLGETEPKSVVYQGERKEISGKYIQPYFNKNNLVYAVIFEKDEKLYIKFKNS